MAYTRVWAQVLNLLGARDSDEIDDASREAHLDFQERFSDILYDVVGDPWKVRIPGVAVDGIQSVRIPATPAVATLGTPTRNNFDVQPGGTGAPNAIGLAIPIIVPIDSTLISVEVVGYRTAAGATVQLSVAQLDYTTELFTSLSVVSLPLVQAGKQITSTGPLNVAMPSNKSFYASLFAQADASGVATARISSIGVIYKLAGV